MMHGTCSKKSVVAGFATLEVLLAMTILVLTLASVTLTTYGSQSMQMDAETGTEALHRAQDGLELMQTLSRKDFHLVVPTSSDETIGNLTYHRVVSVTPTTAPDYATKEITSTVTWIGEHNRPQHVSLSALVTNFDHAAGGDTCDSVPSGNWALPVVVNSASADMVSLIATSSGAINAITSLDAYKGKLYVTVNGALYKTDPRFFVFDIPKLKTDPTHALIGKLTTATKDTPAALCFAACVEPARLRQAKPPLHFQTNGRECLADNFAGAIFDQNANGLFVDEQFNLHLLAG
jgi:Tfp pilus assembly protein PilV